MAKRPNHPSFLGWKARSSSPTVWSSSTEKSRLGASGSRVRGEPSWKAGSAARSRASDEPINHSPVGGLEVADRSVEWDAGGGVEEAEGADFAEEADDAEVLRCLAEDAGDAEDAEDAEDVLGRGAR